MTDSSVKPDANSGNRKHYATAKAFRTALEERLRQQSRRDRIDLQRLRRRVAFERFLARLFRGDKPVWLLKGGYSLELRLQDIARATIDIDLSVPTPNAAFPPDGNQLKKVREQLQIATEHDPGDWFTFALSTATPELQGPPEGGISSQYRRTLIIAYSPSSMLT
jgi:hypothetical protein